MDRIDQGIEYSEQIECEIDTLMRRLLDTDSDGMMRIEALLHKLRVEQTVISYVIQPPTTTEESSSKAVHIAPPDTLLH